MVFGENLANLLFKSQKSDIKNRKTTHYQQSILPQKKFIIAQKVVHLR